MFKEFCSNLFVPEVVRSLRRGYSAKFFLNDLLAGLSLSTIAFPLSIAYAIAGGLDPSKGFYSSIIGGFLIALLSGSRVQFGGPTGTLAILIFNIVQNYGYDGLCTATLITGALLLIFALMRLGTLIRFIPDSVTAAYAMAIGILIFSSQIFDFFGLHLDKIPSDFLGKWFLFIKSIKSFHLFSLLIGLSALSFIFYMDRRAPRFPSNILMLLILALITAFIPGHIDTIGTRFGEIKRAIPGFTWLFSLSKAPLVFQDAFMMALLISMESILSSVVSDGMIGKKNRPDCELFAQGISNIFCGLFGGMPVASSLSRTITAVKIGAKTPLAGIFHALIIGAFIWIFSSFIKYIPLPALGAVLVLLAWKMSEFKRFAKFCLKAPKSEVLVLAVTFFLIVFVNLMAGIEIGIVLSTALLIKRLSENENAVKITEVFSDPGKISFSDPDAIDKKQVPDEVLVYEINGPFFFGLVERFKDIINRLGPPPKVFILRMRKVSFVDSAAIKAISELHDKCLKQNTMLFLSGVSGQILYDLRHMDIEEKIGREHIFPNIDGALLKAKEFLIKTEQPKNPIEPIPILEESHTKEVS